MAANSNEEAPARINDDNSMFFAEVVRFMSPVSTGGQWQVIAKWASL